MSKDLSWIKELDNPEQFLDKDMRLVYENCGMDTVLSLLTGVQSINVYVSAASVTRAQEEYISQHFDGKNIKELAVKLGCSEMQVYKVNKKIREASKKKPSNQVKMEL